MTFEATKTPLLIAAIATAMALTTPAQAKEHWVSADATATAQIVQADFHLSGHSFKGLKKFKKFKFGGVKKKTIITRGGKKKVVIKKF